MIEKCVTINWNKSCFANFVALQMARTELADVILTPTKGNNDCHDYRLEHARRKLNIKYEMINYSPFILADVSTEHADI